MLTIKNLSKKFGKKTILKNINFTVTDGQLVAIAGPSGGGKTTLLRCLCGLEKIDAGEILVDDSIIDPFNSKEEEDFIGVVFQDFQLFPHLTVLANISLAPQSVLKLARQDAEQASKELLETLGLGDKANLYPYQLSGGQKQRVAIARALAMKPKILCYDEPTSALDPGLRQTVEALLLQLKNQGMTQIVVTHDLDLAKDVADAIFPIDQLNQLEVSQYDEKMVQN